MHYRARAGDFCNSNAGVDIGLLGVSGRAANREPAAARGEASVVAMGAVGGGGVLGPGGDSAIVLAEGGRYAR